MTVDDEATLFENVPRESAAEHLCTRVPVASPSSPVKEIRDSLREGTYESLTHVAILDEARLVGVLTIESLFSAPEGAVAIEVMDQDPPVVAPGTDQELAARQVVRHEECALAVVDEERRFLGSSMAVGGWRGGSRRLALAARRLLRSHADRHDIALDD